MILVADAALATLLAALLFVVYTLSKSIRTTVAILAPFAAAIVAFLAALVASALVFGGSASGGLGHTPTATTILQVSLLMPAVVVGIVVGVLTARLADRWAARPDGEDRSGGPTRARRRRLRFGLATVMAIAGLLVWREHRFWRTVEIASRASDDGTASQAIGRLARMGDPRAVPVLKSLAGRYSWALDAMGTLGEPGTKALLEYLRTSRNPDFRSVALFSLCGTRGARSRDADVVAAIRQSLADRSVQMRVAGIRCVARVLGRPEAVASLTPLLGDEALEARAAAAEELARLADPAGSVP